MSDTVVVVPCFNEEERLRPSAFRQFTREDPSVRFRFVDDGSTDDTVSVLRDLVASEPEQMNLHALETNRGKAEAVRQGVLAALEADPRFVGYWDADLAAPLEALHDLRTVLERRSEVDLALGSRVKLMGREIERHASRHYLGRIFASLASLALGFPVYDTQCGAKLLRANETVRDVFQRPFSTTWFFDVEVLARYRRAARAESRGPVNRAIYEVALSEWHDVSGSKLGVFDMLRAPFELGGIWWRYTRHL